MGDQPAAPQVQYLVAGQADAERGDHIATAAVALAVGPFQFSRRLRRRGIRAHRILGRVYVIVILCAAVSGATTSLWNSMGIRGVSGYFTLDVMWAWTTWLACRAARNRRFASTRPG